MSRQLRHNRFRQIDDSNTKFGNCLYAVYPPSSWQQTSDTCRHCKFHVQYHFDWYMHMYIFTYIKHMYAHVRTYTQPINSSSCADTVPKKQYTFIIKWLCWTHREDYDASVGNWAEGSSTDDVLARRLQLRAVRRSFASRALQATWTVDVLSNKPRINSKLYICRPHFKV